jgi:hypothetical protein
MEKLKCNPWFAIWVKPKGTIQEIVDYNPNYRLGILSAIYGFISLMGISQSFSYGFVLGFFPLIIASIIFSVIWGYFLFSLASFFVYFVGRWLKGQANYKQVRASVAWSTVPMVVNLIIWIVLLVLFQDKIFKDFYNNVPLDAVTSTMLFAFMLIQLILSIWSLVIYINCLSQVQKFSIIRSIFNIIISGIFLMVSVFVFFTVIGWFIVGMNKLIG